MKKTNKIARLDAILGQQKLSKNEMKEVNGGFSCYCNGKYEGEESSVCACCSACGLNNCLGC
jgi:hypothetical protein